LHAHTGLSDGELEPADAFTRARQHGLDFFAVTDHLEQLDARGWARTLEAAQQAQAEDFVALCGFEWGGYPTWSGWMNHLNVVGSEQTLGVLSTVGLANLYRALLRLPGRSVVGQFNHPGMLKAAIGRNNWDRFEYHADADLRMKLMMLETRSSNGED